MSLTDSAYHSLSGILMGLGIATMPSIDGEVLFGASLGAWLVTTTRTNFKAWQRIGSWFLVAVGGCRLSLYARRTAAGPFPDGRRDGISLCGGRHSHQHQAHAVD